MKINICLFFFSLLFLSDLKSAELVIKILNIEENIGSNVEATANIEENKKSDSEITPENQD